MQEGLSEQEQIKSYFLAWKQADIDKSDANNRMTEAKKTLSEILDVKTKKVQLMFKLMDKEDEKKMAEQVLFEIDKLE